jgi:hypothetical protein
MQAKVFHFHDLVCYPLPSSSVKSRTVPEIYTILWTLLKYPDLSNPLVLYTLPLGHFRGLLADLFPEVNWKRYDPLEPGLVESTQGYDVILIMDTSTPEDLNMRLHPAVVVWTDKDGVTRARDTDNHSQVISNNQSQLEELLDQHIAGKSDIEGLQWRVTRMLNMLATSPKPSTIPQLAELTAHITDPKLKAIYSNLYREVTTQLHQPLVRLEDIPHSLPYSEGNKIKKTALHLGQRKLFLNELQFLTQHTVPTKKYLCVYAGAAPSKKGGLLADLMPHVTFLLVDPNKFEIVGKKPTYITPTNLTDVAAAKKALAKIGNKQIYIINGYFTNALATALADREVLFISDIRTADNPTGKPTNLDIIHNLAMQYNWIRLMKPRVSMLKFRYPYYNPKTDRDLRTRSQQYAEVFQLSKDFGIDFITDAEAQRLTYLSGDINLQPWGPISSAETRLVTDGLSSHIYPPLSEYEDKFFYYNNIERSYVRHINSNANPAVGFDLCNDCALENHIWTEYISKMGKLNNASAGSGHADNQVDTLVEELTKIDGRTLLQEEHGKLF